MSELVETEDKPILLQAIEAMLASPADIKKEAEQLKQKYMERYGEDRSIDEINEYAVEKVISNYSYYTAFVGGASGLPGLIPGLGTVLAMTGGAMADAALSMKYQIEMTMAIATIYGYDVTLEQEKRMCLIVAGLGAINEATKSVGKDIGKTASVKMLRQYLTGATLTTVKEIFKKVGITFTRKAAEKVIPFGVGAIIGFSANKGLTWYVGSKAKDFYSVRHLTE